MIQKRIYVFDTFQCIKELVKAGFQQEQAEAQVKLMAELVNQTLCTREDLEKSEERLFLKIESVRKELKVEIEALRKEVKVEIAGIRKDLVVEIESVRKELTLHIIQAKHEMVKWLIGMSIANLGLIFTMFKFLV